MAEHADESSQWIRSLVAGDDRVVAEFWQTYSPALRRLANKQMSPALKQRVDPDDVVQSACRTFFRRARQEQFQLEDSAALWRLLCAVTLTKVRQHARFHRRKRRGMDREISINASESGGIASPVDPGPAPDEAVAFADQLQHLLQELDDEELRLIQLKLEGRDHEQIASILQCSTRSVRRLLAKIRDRWEREIR
jgi:RNA polymerase sigma factor (sigma-70 family)